MSYDSLIPLIKKTGSSLSPKAFQEVINVVFHDIESKHYDALHRDMWGSLLQQFELLAKDTVPHLGERRKLSLLDIGCGTGLSSELLLKTELGNHIDRVTLLDTSSKMLEQAESKAKSWGKEIETKNLMLHELEGSYDIILMSSVLHHIPDLSSFLNEINRVQNEQGIFIHLQDPNGDYLNDNIYVERRTEWEKESHNAPKNNVKSIIPKSLKNRINRILGRKTYIDEINDILLSKNVINKRMTADEIWSVTDIHVEQNPHDENAGISFDFLKRNLKNYSNIGQRSYAFYGQLKSDLSSDFQKREDKHINDHELNGRNLSAVWKKMG